MGIYVQYINNKNVVLASEPVGGRSRETELPCFVLFYRTITIYMYICTMYIKIIYLIKRLISFPNIYLSTI